MEFDKEKKKRNPKWNRDELILTLDLYFQLTPGQIHARNPLIIALSQLLNKLPSDEEKKDAKRFRNPNGVGLKLSNFLSIDDSYAGKGMSSSSILDKAIFKEFEHNREELRKLADAIKMALANNSLLQSIEAVQETEDMEAYSRKEGALLHRFHLSRERNVTLIKKKKEYALKTHGKLACELCEFDYTKMYGEAGIGFIECHHITPLNQLTEATSTKLADLMLVCANCHRMLHRGWNGVL